MALAVSAVQGLSQSVAEGRRVRDHSVEAAVDQSSRWQNDSAQMDWWFDRDSASRDKTDAINEANRYQANDAAWADFDKNLLLDKKLVLDAERRATMTLKG